MEDLLLKARARYSDRFGELCSVSVFAPGRVNLIGEHTDYNEGLVLPFALPLVTVLVGGRAKGGVHSTVVSCTVSDDNPEASFVVGGDLRPGEPKWANYMLGVVAEYYADLVRKEGSSSIAFNAVVMSNVPLGAGLSSSAALE